MTETRQRKSVSRNQPYNQTKCHLCASESPTNTYSRPSAWTEENRQWVNQFCTPPIPPDAPVCRACEKFIKRHTGQADVLPRWFPKPKQRNYCMVEGCREVSHTATSIAKYEVAREHLDLAPIPEADQQLYRELHFPLPCAACSCQPRYGGDYTRRCPDPVQISTYLQQTLDFSGVLTAQSKICKPCYMFHRQILQKRTSDSISAPTFDTIVANLEGKIAEFETSERKSVTD